MNCEKCGRTNKDNARFCASCGNELRTHATTPICPSCHFENPLGSRFCAKCGAEFFAAESVSVNRACDLCGFENPIQSGFCKSCGARLSQHGADRPLRTEQVRSAKPPKHVHSAPGLRARKRDRSIQKKVGLRHPALTLTLIVGGVVLLFTIQSVTKKEPPKPARLIETTSSDAALEAKVREIASKFICSCGKCGEQSLDVCTCNTAIEERQMIRNYLGLGQSSDQVVAAVKNTYGWMKTDLAAQRDSGTQVIPSTKKLSAPDAVGGALALQASNNLAPITRVATAADRTEIFSRFRCPCGQCGIQELKDCNCGHPRGAREVKAFVDAKIAEGRYTVAKVVDEVEAKYGGTKL